MTRVRGRVGPMVILAVVLAAMPPPAARADVCTHCYSYAVDSSESAYTGVDVTRYDVRPTNHNAGEIFQSEWVLFTNGWVELGTDHWSDGTHFWYCVYQAPGGSWTTVCSHEIKDYAQHDFHIVRSSPLVWDFWVDGTKYRSLTTASELSGYQVEVGLETYDNAAHVSAYADSYLMYTVNGGGWTYWAGQDGSRVDPYMCGHWATPSQWILAENGPC